MLQTTEKSIPTIECIRCGKEIPINKVFGFDGEIGYCIDCYIGGGLGSAVLDHSYKPTPIFSHLSTEKPTKKEGLLYLGLELETENRTVNIQKYAFELQKKYPVYVKHDGSLRRGMEIVSHPQTVKHHQKIFKWYELLRELREDHWTSYDNGRCGLHIHVNRNFFDRKDEILKVVFFYYKCFDKLRQFTKRSNTSYCQKWGSSLLEIIRDYRGKVQIGANNDDRNSCINTQNSKTVEFRMCRGTLNYDRFLASLLFTDAICSFVRNYSVAFFINKKNGSRNLWHEFIKYVDGNGRYDFLGDYLKKQKLYDPTPHTLDIPPYEDYLSKKQMKFVKLTGSELKKMVVGSGIEPFILKELNYEFSEEEMGSIEFLQGENYVVYTKGGVPKWAIPKALVKLELKKRVGLTSLTIAGILRKFLDRDIYFLRVMRLNGTIHKEVSSISSLFRDVFGDNYGNYGSMLKVEERMKDFIVGNSFKYEIIRSDAVNVYNNS